MPRLFWSFPWTRRGRLPWFLLGCLVLSLFIGQAFGQTSPQSTTNNVFVGTDERLFVTLAALNLAGFDAETPGAPPNEVRAELLRDLQATPPEVTEKLRAFWKQLPEAERTRSTLLGSAVALALIARPLPEFTLPPSESLPPDVRPLAGLAPLIAEFAARSPVKSVFPKYAANYAAFAELLQQVAQEELFRLLTFLHTQPIVTARDAPPLADLDTLTSASLPAGEMRERTRRLFILPDLLGPVGRVVTRNDFLDGSDRRTYRRPGDEFFLVVSAPREAPNRPLRRALMRFILEPVIARSAKLIADRRAAIVKLAGSAPNADPALKNNVFEIVRESLGRAIEARLSLQEARAAARAGADDARAALILADEEARIELLGVWERGGVLALHFFEQLAALDETGVDILEWLPRMVTSFDTDRERRRPTELADLRARVERRRARAAPVAAGRSRIEQADDLLRAKKYAEARQLLEMLVREEPTNARAAFGLAELTAKQPSAIELDADADESDKLAALQERFELAVELYERAAKLAQADERWLASRAHVAIGKLYDLADRRPEAIAAYERAIAIGDVRDGAYAEAVAGKARPFRPDKP
ncbi:tetratricopeptide repeat protein [Chloracidobacterium validum]|uniref:Tetratricopeptide repeat protein n=1 Tax=Chloracidobacterium validum TaxID=2821543 RepID=A0ABX8BAD7_9BACT|nr:tetratricopeptide repeat protein [Chloracidobacterium validum]QUW03631.1 tetratricopeptide repeat protein [Chloracidobacterium validum]